jgi:hypothetical protein
MTKLLILCPLLLYVRSYNVNNDQTPPLTSIAALYTALLLSMNALTMANSSCYVYCCSTYARYCPTNAALPLNNDPTLPLTVTATLLMTLPTLLLPLKCPNNGQSHQTPPPTPVAALHTAL